MMKITKLITFWLCLFGCRLALGQSATSPIPQLVEKGGRHSLLVDGKPFFLLGGQAHNSSGWPAMMPQVWQAIHAIHANTLEVPIYWEQIEPQQGKFDFSIVDTLLTQARQHQVRLVLLWFATWKNGSSHYMPEWMKLQPTKYPNITGREGNPVDSPSPHIRAAMEADCKAFASVMRYLKRSDPQRTVIMVQVENEPGAWGSVRDYSPLAEQLFHQEVPSELMKPDLLKAMHVPLVNKGSWQNVFGDRADEYFQAWSVAHYIGQVAAAGKAEYALPLYTNVALRDPLTNPKANNYESGGATDNVIPIWKIAAPAIDLLAPDIYERGNEKIMKVIDLYDRPDNALFVPEAALNPDMAKYLYEVIARGGIGFSPFGIDDNSNGSTPAEISKRLDPFGQEYDMAARMIAELAGWGASGKMKALIEREDHQDQVVNLGEWSAFVSFGTGAGNALQPNPLANGKMMIAELDQNKFVVIGTRSHITFKPRGSNAARAWQYLKVEEGYYENGLFKPIRILNGDETDWGGPRFGDKPTVLLISLVLR